MLKRLWLMTFIFVMVFSLIAPAIGSLPTAVANDSAIQSDFEDGTAQGWYGRGDTAAVVNTEAHSGTFSLQSTGRTQGWMGPGMNVTSFVEQGGAYRFEAWVKLAAGQPDAVVNAMVERQTGGNTSFEGLAIGTTIVQGQWVKISGTYELIQAVDFFQIYLESPNATLSFYVDDVIFERTNEPSTDFLDDFEDGTTQGWGPRIGTESVTIGPEAAHGGISGLKVGGRTVNYSGASKDVTSYVRVGATYTFTAWLKLAPGFNNETIQMTMQRNVGTNESYESISFESANSGNWVKIEGSYTLNAPAERLAVYFEAPNGQMEFYIDDFQMVKAPDQPPIEIETDIPNLKDVLANDFVIGTAFTNDELIGANSQLMAKHFNSITPGNAMKWDSTEPREGELHFENTDPAVQFGKDNGMLIRGHTLVWHSQTPNWVFYDENGQLASKELLYARMQSHIQALMTRYKDDIYAWDVVNEVINTSQPDGLRRSLWYQIAGEEYIEKAFIFAHEADPDAKLFINDYNTHDPAKSQQLRNLTERLQAKGIPLDGVGHQMHIDIEYPSVDLIEASIVKFADLGLEQHVTEMDMSAYTDDGQRYTVFTEEMALKQAYRYKEIFDMFKQHKDQITSVTLWGKDDAHTWLRTFPVVRLNWPLLFDDRLQSKPAYWALVNPSVLPVYTKRMDVSKGTPDKIDGKWDEQWDLANPLMLRHSADYRADVKVMWDTSKLYILADVKDGTDNDEDRVQIFVDENHAKTPAYEVDDHFYTLKRKKSGTIPAGVKYSAKTSDDGYVLEAEIPLTSLTASSGAQLGFDIRIQDGADSSKVIVWNDVSLSQETSTAVFGDIVLSEAPRMTAAVKGKPIVDGIKDAVWANANEIQTELRLLNPEGATAKVKTMWDSDNRLYLYAEITDSVLGNSNAFPWEQDTLEIFIDENFGRTTQYEEDDSQYRIGYNNSLSFGGGASNAKIVSAASVVPGGYVIEASIMLDGLNDLKGERIGFDLQINDDQGEGSRQSAAKWNDPTNNSFRDTSRYGLLYFIKQ